MSDTILLVEDSEDDVFFMERAMSAAGLISTLKVVPDGQKALNYLEGSGIYADRLQYPLPCLILLDLKLPLVLGLDVLKWIRSRPDFQIIPVIVLTSSGELSDLERAYRFGANSFMVKPADFDELVELAKCFGSYWFKYNIIPRLK